MPVRSPRARLGRHELVVAVVALVAGFLALACSDVHRTAPDFQVYRDAAGAAWRGVDVYRLGTSSPGSTGNPFTYPPFAALVLLPFTWVGWPVGYVVWSALSMLALARVLDHVVPDSTRRRTWLVALAVGASSSTWVVVNNLGYGQVNLVLMWLCLTDGWRRADSSLGRWVPRGVLVGIAAAVKVTPALFLVHFAVTRQWRLLGWSLLGGAAASTVGAVAYPTMTRTFFGGALWHLTDRVDLGHSTGYWGNSSLTGAFAALGLPGLVARVAVAVAAVGALAAARRAHRDGRALDAWLVVGVAAPLLSPYSWGHHHVYLLPALTRLALTRGRSLRRASRALVGLAAGVVLVGLLLSPGLGQSALDRGSPLLVVPGLLQREVLVLLAAAAVVMLGQRSGGSDPNCATRPGMAVRLSSTAVVSGTSSRPTLCGPPAVVATRVVRPARRWNQVLR